jgi:hypothetical protein
MCLPFSIIVNMRYKKVGKWPTRQPMHHRPFFNTTPDLGEEGVELGAGAALGLCGARPGADHRRSVANLGFWKGVAEKFFRWGAAEGRIFLGSGRGDGFLGVVLSVAQRLHTAEGHDGGGCGSGSPLPLRGSGGITPGDFFILWVFVCAFLSAERAHFSKKGVLRNAKMWSKI